MYMLAPGPRQLTADAAPAMAASNNNRPLLPCSLRSGGLVLPFAHNGFLVGLLVVERCLEEGEPMAAGSGAAAATGTATGAAAAAAGSSGSGSSSNGSSGSSSGSGAGPSPAPAAAAAGSSTPSSNGAGAMPQPPACLLFRSAEVQLLKQTAAVLALADEATECAAVKHPMSRGILGRWGVEY